MSNNKKVAVWVAAPPETMSHLQQCLYGEWGELADLPAACVQEDRNRDSKVLDSEAFLQAYIEGIAAVLLDHIIDSKDKHRTAACQAINWPSLWMTKILDTVKNPSKEFVADDLLEENLYGIHTVPIQPTQFAYQSITQICVPVSVGAIQAGIAYLVLSVPEAMEDIHRELYLSKSEAMKLLETFRINHRFMLQELLELPWFSVISSHAIHL